MLIDHWLAFVAASAILLAIPGPTVLLVISYALSHGRKPAAAIVAGVALGDLTAMTASMLGMGTILATSATVFTLLRWIGGAYLIYLGIGLWRAPIHLDPAGNPTNAPPGGASNTAPGDAPDANPRRMFVHAYAVTALNPKSIIFFVAFVPQFLETTRPFLPQVATLEATFVTLAAANAALFVILAAAVRQKLRNPRVRRAINRTGGTLLIAAGALAAGWRKAGA
jgi:threonine/homoserine/homoserine lactone efflux protein